jgi:hypothetical protein
MQPDAAQERNKPFECRVILLDALSFLEEEVPMAYNQQYFRIDKSTAINVRTVSGEKIHTF